MSDPPKRVDELEQEVSRLAESVRDLEAQRDALLRDARNRHHPQAPNQHSWIGRLILLALTAAAGSAAYFMFRGADFSFAQLTALGSDVAALDTDAWMLACVLCIGAAMVFYVLHRRLLFGFAAMSALYGTHWAYFAEQPAALHFTDEHYFWISTALLTIAYTLLAYLSVHECRRHLKGRRRWALFAFVNATAFFATVRVSIEDAQPDRAWQFYLFFALLLTGMAVIAETPGPYRNAVFQLYVAMAVLMTNLALASLLDERWFALVLGAECASLAITFRQSGFVLFKLINVAILAATVVYGVRLSTGVHVGEEMAAWLASGTLAFILLTAAALYTHGMRERTATERKTSGHWSFADTALDINTTALSVLHAAGATLVLIAAALFSFSDNDVLPFSMAGVAVALFLLGVFSQTPAIEFAGVLVLASAQAAYGYSFMMDVDTSLDAYTARALAGALAAVSIAIAWRWDYTMRRDETATALEYAAGIAVPYIAAGLMIAAVTQESILPEYAEAVQYAAAIACLIAFRRWRSGGMRIVALTLTLTGAMSFVLVCAWPAMTGNAVAHYWPWFAVALLAPLVAERILTLQFGTNRWPAADAARTVLVVLGCLTGLIGLFCGAPEYQRAWWWLAMAGVAAVCGIAFREGRYRWSAMITLVAAVVLIATSAADEATTVRVFPFIAASIAVSGILVVSWAAAMRNQWAGHRHRDTPRDEE